MKKIIITAVIFSITSFHGNCQNYKELIRNRNGNPLELIFKKIDTVSLRMKIFLPEKFKPTKKYPSIIFFFGGGWVKGDINQFESHSKYFASRGMISILADYRVRDRHGTTPFDAVSDAKSAIRFLRIHSEELNLIPDKISAAGSSAGGHLAAAAGNITGLEETGEDLSVSSKPDALILFSPVFDNGPGGYGYERFGDRYPEISPIHNIKPGAPPTIVFLGTVDKLIPVSTAEKFRDKMKEAGNRCDLFLYEGQPHSFSVSTNKVYYQKTVHETDLFLHSLGYLRGKPKI